MSPDASELLDQWYNWIPINAKDNQFESLKERWEKGIKPPKKPFNKYWPWWDICPKCNMAELMCGDNFSGVKCPDEKCGYWFCY